MVLASATAQSVFEQTCGVNVDHPALPCRFRARRRYKLCWAHAPEALTDFQVELDAEAMLGGPHPAQDLECTLGLACTFTLEGVRPSASNPGHVGTLEGGRNMVGDRI